MGKTYKDRFPEVMNHKVIKFSFLKNLAKVYKYSDDFEICFFIDEFTSPLEIGLIEDNKKYGNDNECLIINLKSKE